MTAGHRSTTRRRTGPKAWVACGALVALALGVAACSVGGSSPASNVSLPAEPSSVTATEVVAWSEASSRVGEIVIVEGPVVSATRAGGSGGSAATLLNIGRDAPDTTRFLAVIPDSARARFAQPPAEAYVGMLVHVSGKIVLYDGVAAIMVTSPRQIKIAQ